MILDFMNECARILTALQAIAPEAHVAGGAVRDWLLERPVKDIDVFVSSDSPEAKVAKAVRKFRPVVERVVDGAYFASDRSVCGSVEYADREHELPPINIIRLTGRHTIESNIARFDLGLCRAAFDGKEIITHADFRRDVRFKRFTVRKCENADQFALSLARFNRLEAKYPGWLFNVPEEFAHFDTRAASSEFDFG